MAIQVDRYTVGKVAIALGVGVGAYLVYRKLKNIRYAEEWVQVGTVSEIVIYPIKSCKGRSVAKAECFGLGLKYGECYDRQFVIINDEGKFLTARDEPKSVLIDAELESGILTLMAPGKEPIRVDLDRAVATGNVSRVELWLKALIDAFDCGPEVANWLSDYLEKPAKYRLVYHTPGLFNNRKLDTYKKYKGKFDKRKDLTMFANLTPYLLMTEASMDDLNSRAPDGEQFSLKNFRPNFIVSGTKPFDEDNWEKVRIGEEALFTNVLQCTRCLLTTVNGETGEKHPRLEPLRTLRSYRVSKRPEDKKYYGFSPLLGIHLAIDRFGLVQAGDPVYATYKRG